MSFYLYSEDVGASDEAFPSSTGAANHSDRKS